MRKSIIWALMLLLAVGIVSATTTLVAPATSGIVSGSYKFNISCGTYDGNTSDTTYWAVVESYSVSTANSSWAVFANSSRNHSSYVTLNGQANVTKATGNGALEDASDYQFRTTCYNSSGVAIAAVSAVVSTVIVDNTVPAIELVSVTAGSTLTENAEVTARIRAANVTADNNMGIWFGSNYYALTRSGDTVSFTVGRGKPADGIYEVKFSASDQRNSTETRIADVKVKTYPSGGGALPDSVTLTGQQYAQIMGVNVTPNVIIVVIVVMFFVLNMAGGKRKR